MNPLGSRNTDLMKKDLVQMLHGTKVGSLKYAVVDSARHMTQTGPPKVKGPKVPASEMRKPASGKLKRIFG